MDRSWLLGGNRLWVVHSEAQRRGFVRMQIRFGAGVAEGGHDEHDGAHVTPCERADVRADVSTSA